MSLFARSKRSGCNIVMKKIKNPIFNIKKYLEEKKFFTSKQKIIIKKNNSLANLGRTFLSSLIIVSIFFIMPIIVNFKNENRLFSKDFENNSKNDFKKTLEDQSIKLDDKLNSVYLFDDVLDFEDLPTDTIRLSAATIEQLFKDTNYNLKDVRKTKLVKPVSLSLLPAEIKEIENIKKRKELFIQIILPLIIKENNSIKLDRKRLFSILNKNKNTTEEKKWLEKKFKQYGTINKDLSTLKIRMDEVPVSMAIAQAAKETGWGTSRFALEGNALFGQWTWSGEGIKPAGAADDTTHKVMKFKVLQASVKAYQRNLNTHSSYREFRSVRAQLRDEGKVLDSLILSEFIGSYAETGKKYIKILQQIIRQNQLTDFDDAKLLPSSIELESLI
jgi:Bax protein